MRSLRMVIVVVAATALFFGSTGCGSRDQREQRDPLLRRAQAKKAANDIEGAVETYLKVIEKKPRLARAHLELGWIYDHDLNDYVRAIYHYQRYLELRPDAKERDLVQDLIHNARLSFAASLPDQPNAAVRRIRMLEEENQILRAEIARLTSAPLPAGAAGTALKPERQPREAAAGSAGRTTAGTRGAVAADTMLSAQTAGVAVAAGTVAGATPRAPAPVEAQGGRTPSTEPAVRPAAQTTYVVQPGDTLGRIAARFYGDTKKWQVIYEANRASLPGGPQSLRVGQTLVIPKAEGRPARE